MKSDPRNALAAFRAYCWTNAQLIRDFVMGREHFALTFDKAEELDEMVDVLAEQMEGMEDTWDSILEIVRACSINTSQDTLFGELSRLVVSTRRIVDVALKWSGQFYVESPVHEGPGQEETVNEVASGTLDDVVGEDSVNDDGSRQGADTADNDGGDENVGNGADDDEGRHVVKEVVPQWSNLTRGVLEKALTDRWNQDPGVCFCRVPEKHPEPITIPEGYVKSRRSVFDTSRRLCYIEIDRVRAFVSRHNGLDPTRGKLEELGTLRTSLKEQWRYVKLMVTSEGPEVLSGSDNVGSALGEAVDAALLCSGEFIERCLAKPLGDEDTGTVDDKVTPESTHRQEEVAVKSVIMEHVEKWTGFTECKQAQNEVFEVWWDRMQAKAGNVP